MKHLPGRNALLGCTLLASLALPAQAALADKAHPVIGFTVYDMSSFISLGKGGVEKVAKADNVSLLWNSAGMDVNTQISQIQQFINQKVDAIIIAAVNSSTLGPSVAAAKAAGIPVILTNLSVPDAVMKDAVSYVGPDDVKAGEQEADALMGAMQHKGAIVVLQGPLGQSGEIDRTKGIQNVLGRNPDVKLLAMQPGDWARNKAYGIMQDWLSRYGSQITGVIGENDDMAIGAIQAMREKGLQGKDPHHQHRRHQGRHARGPGRSRRRDQPSGRPARARDGAAGDGRSRPGQAGPASGDDRHAGHHQAERRPLLQPALRPARRRSSTSCRR